jgi:phytoene/squalene synthetase
MVVNKSAYTLDTAYAYCANFVKADTGMWILSALIIPKRIRKHFYTIWAYGFTVDDITDEGDLTKEQRLAQIQPIKEQLLLCYQGIAEQPLFIALCDTIQRFSIPQPLLLGYINAHIKLLNTKRFQTFNDLLTYMDGIYSTGGRITLLLLSYQDTELFKYADKLLTAYGLLDNLIDLSHDLSQGCLFIPLEHLKKFNCTEEDIFNQTLTDNVRALIAYEVSIAEDFLVQSQPIFRYLKLKDKLNAKLFYYTCDKIAHKIKVNNYNVFFPLIRLNFLDKLHIMIKALKDVVLRL